MFSATSSTRGVYNSETYAMLALLGHRTQCGATNRSDSNGSHRVYSSCVTPIHASFLTAQVSILIVCMGSCNCHDMCDRGCESCDAALRGPPQLRAPVCKSVPEGPAFDLSTSTRQNNAVRSLRLMRWAHVCAEYETAVHGCESFEVVGDAGGHGHELAWSAMALSGHQSCA